MTSHDPGSGDDPIRVAIAWVSRFAAMATLAELGCGDQLRDGPLTVDELAARCKADPAALGRVLREAASIGLVTHTPAGYALTEAGRPLRSDVPESQSAALRMIIHESFWQGLASLADTVRRGRPTVHDEYGSLYDYLAAHPSAARIFDDYMQARSAHLAAALPAAYDFSTVDTLVDVGGGNGHLLAAVLAANPGMRGVLFDRDHVTAAARDTFAESGLADRVELVAGDFSVGVPEGGDAYLLAAVLHNYGDAYARRILGRVRAAMPPAGRVLILEQVLPDDETPHIGKDTDIRMLALFDGGKERSRHEHATLLESAELRLLQIHPLPGGSALIEAAATGQAS